MALPRPRSYQQILGDMLTTFLARRRIPALRTGSPVLTIMEAAATSDARASQDVFRALSARSLDALSGRDLDEMGREEGVPRLGRLAATGVVTFSDESFERVATQLSPGRPAPIAGTETLYLVNAEDFAASGEIYLGRLTDSFEGPISYSSVVDSGGYWTMTLDAPLVRGHNVGTEVVMAQGGVRVIPGGTVVSTSSAVGSGETRQYTTLFTSQILDGETSVEGVDVVASVSGGAGNVPEGTVTQVPSPPFPGCAVTNPAAITNGRDTETDADYRERIRRARGSRARGTDLAVLQALQGLSSTEESKRILSVDIVRRENALTQVVIDDGAGYEEVTEAVAIEPLISEAAGGETRVAVLRTPIAQAALQSALSQPFALSADARLALEVGGVVTEHVFAASDFASPLEATAYEIVASVNADSSLDWVAKVIDGGRRVSFQARNEAPDDLQVAAVSGGTDISEALGLSEGQVQTLRLYKNDRLLQKDGRVAALYSSPLSAWTSFSGSKTLTVSVDGTTAATYTFVDQDFVDAGTTYSTVGRNSLAAWAAVINLRIPGVTADVIEGRIRLVSNLGRSDRASLEITGGTLLDVGAFSAGSSTGLTSQYTLNRQQGEILLAEPLEAGDTLTLGSLSTRAFLESAEGTYTTPVTLAAEARLWLCIDGQAEAVDVSVNATDDYDLTKLDSGAWGERWEFAATGAMANALSGDWLVLWDSAIPAALQGVWRVAKASANAVEFDAPTTGESDVLALNLTQLGLRVVRSERAPVLVTLPAGANYTPTAISSALEVDGAAFLVDRTENLRVRTNTFDDGDIALVGADIEGAQLGLPEGLVTGNAGHVASVVGAAEGSGTPRFVGHRIHIEGTTLTEVQAANVIRHEDIIVGERNFADNTVVDGRWGNNSDFVSPIVSRGALSGGAYPYETRKNALQLWAATDRFFSTAPYALAPEDDLIVVADNDEAQRRYVVPMYRRLSTVGTTYSQTIEVADADNADESLAQTFGVDFVWADFAVYMRSRLLMHSATASKRVLWRWHRMGPDGDSARLRYDYPDAPNSAVSVDVEHLRVVSPNWPESCRKTLVSIYLPSGAARTGVTLAGASKVGYGVYTGTNGTNALTLALGFAVASASRTTNVTTLTLTAPSGLYSVTNHGLSIGDKVWVESTNVNFTSGLKTLTGVGALTVSYAETAANIGATFDIGTLSVGSSEAKFTGSTVIAGDIVRLEDFANIPADLRGRTVRIHTLGAQYLQGYLDGYYDPAISQALSWSALGDLTQIKFYPLTAITAAGLVAAVNALESTPVTGTVTGTGLGTIDRSTREEAASEDEDLEYLALVDGVNYVESTNTPSSLSDNYELTLKADVDASLLTDSDWANEELRLVPITARGVVDWLSSSVSGLVNSVGVDLARSGRAPQLTSLTPGSAGSVQVRGGTANSASMPVLGNLRGVIDDTGAYNAGLARVATAQATALAGRQWVSVENTLRRPRPGVFGATLALTSANATTGLFTFSAGSLYTVVYGDVGLEEGEVDITLQGQGFVHLTTATGQTWASSGDVEEGDWVSVEATGPDPISSGNAGVFRIVRLADSQLWYYNPSAVAEATRTCTLRLLSADSLVPGDTLEIASSVWGADKVGTWRVAEVGAPTVGGSPYTANTMRLDVSNGSFVSSGAVAALGSESSRFTVIEREPLKVYKEILGVATDIEDPEVTNVLLDTYQNCEYLSENAGGVLTVLDKLAFPSAMVPGIDGYRYHTGLLGEANRVLYGDLTDSGTYPGVVASGTRIALSGPLVRRIKMSLAVRVRLGTLPSRVLEQVRASVIAAINSSPIGRPISLSRLVEVAEGIPGVDSVVVLAPTYNATNDRILLAAGEKALVVQESDISVSSFGV